MCIFASYACHMFLREAKGLLRPLSVAYTESMPCFDLHVYVYSLRIIFDGGWVE